VQWHPERSVDSDEDKASRALFRSFIDAATRPVS
jgi:gamma-glutamyl-gamma-aminobutyrate hydrolase PuuD